MDLALFIFFLSIRVVVALFMEVSYWSAMVLANSSFKFCRSVVKLLSLSSKFSNSCSTYIFLLRGVMLQLFPGFPERWCISARMNTRTFWASFIETVHNRPCLEGLPLLSCYSFEIFRQSKYNVGLLNKWMWEKKRVHWRITEFWGSVSIYGGSKQYFQFFPRLGFWYRSFQPLCISWCYSCTSMPSKNCPRVGVHVDIIIVPQ